MNTVTTSNNGQCHDYVTTELARSVDFIAISIHRWRGRYKARCVSPKVKDKEIPDELITPNQWKLMPPDWDKKFTQIAGKIHNVVDGACILNPKDEDEDDRIANNNVRQIIKFPIKGMRIIPRRNVIRLFDAVEEIENNEFRPLVEKLGAQWSSIVEERLKLIADQPAEVQAAFSSLMPTSGAALMTQFYIVKCRVPINLAHDNIEAYTGQDATESIQKMKAAGERFTNMITETIIEGLNDELSSAVDNLTNRIGEGGVIKEGTLEMVRTAFKKFRDFDFVMTPGIQDQMENVAKLLKEYAVVSLNKSLKDLGAKSITVKLANHIKDVKVLCLNSTAQMRVAKGGRRILV
jgi:hypothetical protein